MIMKRGYRSLGELLEVVPGLHGVPQRPYLRCRRSRFERERQRENHPPDQRREFNNLQEPNYLNGPINLDNVERVEVVVGPSSFFQRANTLAATINVITRDTEGTEVIASSGNALPYSGTFMTGHKWGIRRPRQFLVHHGTKDRLRRLERRLPPQYSGQKPDRRTRRAELL